MSTPIAAELLQQQGRYDDFIGRVSAAFEAVREAEAFGDIALDPFTQPQENFNTVNHVRYELHSMAHNLKAYKALLVSERPSL